MNNHTGLFERACLIAGLALWAAPASAQHGVIREYAALAPTENAQPLQPLLEEPLADVSITLGPDKAYYLTGSPIGPDGSPGGSRVQIWKSADLKAWDKVRVLDLAPARVRSPEIHFLKGAFWLTLGLGGGGTDLLKFNGTDLASAGYARAKITPRGEDPSLFLDDDGTFYWVLGAGEIARMKGDPLAGLAGDPRPTAPAEPGKKAGKAKAKKPDDVKFAGARGAFLAKIEGRYCLFTADAQMRNGFGRLGLMGGTRDTFVAFSGKPTTGYSTRCLAFPHAGQTTLFRDAAGAWRATFSGRDERAIFRDRAGAFKVDVVTDTPPRWPIGFHGEEKPDRVAPMGMMLRPDTAFLYERGRVGQTRPIPLDKVPGSARDVAWIRDACIILGHDGNYYLTGTAGDMDAVHLWKSADLKKWDYLTAAFRFAADKDLWYNQRPNRLLWAPEIHYLKGTYYITFCISGGGISLLRSTTGRAEGPYELTVKGNRPLTPTLIDASLFQDDDGAIYLVWQGRLLQKLNDDLSDFTGDLVELKTVDDEQVGYEGVFLRKISGWYVVTAAEWDGGSNRTDGTYDMMYAVSKKLVGPYSRRRVTVPHAGHGMLFQDKSGRWCAAMFGNDRTAPFRAMPGFVPLDLADVGGDLLIKPAGD